MPAMTRFGAFCRERREALGLSLREFCRRNGFDPGNTSRLEQGKAKPPRSPELLNAYAEALSLEPKTQAWQMFFDLAAAQTRRVPDEIAGTQDNLSEVFRALRRERHREGTWTSALDLDSWAQTRDAQAQLRRLVRRLVHATASVERIFFPAGEGIQQPGWDGLVQSTSGNAFVPAGLSAWKLSVRRDVKQKADQEQKKRRQNPLGLTPNETSFVFVTARKWPGKDEWCRRVKEAGDWLDVRAYDADDLEAWLELAPAVDAWFARSLGRKPAAVTDIDDYWDDLRAISTPTLKPEVFLASRNDSIDVLKMWLFGPSHGEADANATPTLHFGSPSSLAFEARSPAEVVDFFAAFVAGMNASARDAVASRIIIVEEKQAWLALASEKSPLVLVAKPGLQVEAEMAARALRNGHHVLLSSTRFTSDKVRARDLPRCFRHDLEKALVASGFQEHSAAQLARESGGSLTVLKRRISRFASTSAPEWSHSANAIELAPLILVGAWQDNVDADRRVLEEIIGRSYSEILPLATRWLHTEDPPLIRLLTQWSLMSREDSWVMLGPYLTSQQLDAFENVVIAILAEDDPQLEAEAHEHTFARLYGKRLIHSGILRGALAETLGLLGARPECICDDDKGGAHRAATVVRALFGGGVSWKRWASLSSHLPVLAEAAPEAFLETVKADLDSSSPQLPRLFEDEGDPLFSSCAHAGLLWALEALAWSPTYLSTSSQLLARLHQLDKGERWANRPFSSLVEIFLPWIPHTAANVRQRIKVLRRLTDRVPDVGWKLLLKLLPSLHRVSAPTHKPTWRDWAMDWTRGVTNKEYWQQVEACAARLTELVGSDAARWSDVLDELEHFPDSHRGELLDRLQSFDLSTITPDQRKHLADKLGEKVRRHRAFRDARWALSSGRIECLDLAAKHFEPDDLVARNTWLFTQWPNFMDDCVDYSERERKLAQSRQQVLREVLATGGLEDILRLARSSEAPSAVGFELARIPSDVRDADILPRFLDTDSNSDAQFAAGFIGGKFSENGWQWVKSISIDSWPPSVVADLAVALPNDPETWQWIESLGSAIKERYWKTNPWFPVPKTGDDVRYVATCLLENGRPSTAINALAMSLRRGLEVDTELLMDALDRQNSDESVLSERPPRDLGHHIQELFKTLQSQSAKADLEWLARLEWVYLSALDGHGASPKTLHRLLQSKPDFFVDALRLVFRSEDEAEKDTQAPTEGAQDRAMQAYRLLHDWKTVPGTSEDSAAVDEEPLMKWIHEARRLSKESGHLKICDSQLGRLLAHAPGEADGSWPCVPVRDALDEIDTDEAENGFVVGVRNKRGVVTKSPFEGGEQERKEAAKYTAYADACNDEWPRVTSALRSVARDYEETAKREDASAEARK